MANIIDILTNNRQKIPSWKTDVGRNLVLLNSIIPRKTHISGNFHLKTIINSENRLYNGLIF